MSNPTQPPLPNDPLASYTVAADGYPSALPNDLEEEKDDDDSSGEGGGKDSRKYKVILDPLVEYADDGNLSEEENTIYKLRKLGLAPMSFLASGGSAFASENDLSRKVFMADVGLTNKEILPRDIANPHLFKTLDTKQAERRALFGIKTLDEIVSGAIGAAGAAIAFVSESVRDYINDKREEKKASKLLQNFEEGSEAYALDDVDSSESKASLETSDFPVQNNQGDELVQEERERIYDSLSRQTQYDLDTGKIGFAEAFNTLSDIVLLSKDPVRPVRLMKEIHFDTEDVGTDKELNPMGG